MDRLYWVDYQLDQIGHIDIQGSDRQTFTHIGEITQPYSLTVYAGGFYDDLLLDIKIMIIVIIKSNEVSSTFINFV